MREGCAKSRPRSSSPQRDCPPRSGFIFGRFPRLPVPRVCLLLFTLHCTLYTAHAQPWAGFGIEGRIMEGNMIRHAKSFTGPLPESVRAVEVNFLNQTHGRQGWQARRGYPVVGLAAMYTDYGIDSIYGKAVAVFPNIQARILTMPRFKWTARLGWGLGYATRRYDRADRPTPDTINSAIGSHLNGVMNLFTDARYRLDDHWQLALGAHFHHISNAAVRRPNLGLNVYGVHASVRYSPVTSRPMRIPAAAPPPRSGWWAGARAGLGFEEVGAPDGPLFPIYIGSVFGGRRWRGFNRWFVGADASYHTRIEAFLKNNEIAAGDEGTAAWKGAVFGGNEFLFGRTSVIAQVGVYVREAYLKLDPFYQKVGGHYYILQREKGEACDAFIGIFLKTHKSQAEFFEFGAGLGF